MPRETEYGPSYAEAWSAIERLEAQLGRPCSIRVYKPRQGLRGVPIAAQVVLRLGESSEERWQGEEGRAIRSFGRGGDSSTFPAALYVCAMELAGWLDRRAAVAERQAAF